MRACIPHFHRLTRLFSKASLSSLATQGITLTEYYAITHPSQPNYVAAAGGSTFQVTGDSFYRIGADKKTVVDLLDAKNISWSLYQEDMPYSDFEGNWKNQKNGANDYVRKHKYVLAAPQHSMG